MSAAKGDKFRAIPNPYIVGNPIKDRKMFFGRQDDFAYINKKVTGGKKGGVIVLCGARRSGKTSILFQIKGGRLGDAFLPVLIDMQSMTMQSDGDFLAKLAQEAIESIGDPSITFERDFEPGAAENPFRAFEDLVKKISTRLRGKKFILMFDEYELFETHIDKQLISTDILNFFANWIEHEEGVFIIFTGSDKLESRNVRYWERFLGKALHRRISFLSRTDTLRLIREPVRDYVRYDTGVPEEIYKLTAGQPFYTQVLCQTLVDHLNESGKYDVTAKDLSQVVREIIENPLPQMIFSWSNLSDLEKLILSIIAELNKKTFRKVVPKEILSYPVDESIGFKIDSNKLHESLEKLFHHDLLHKDSERDTYSFKMDLWRQWMARMHSIWQVTDELARNGRQLGEGVAQVGRRRSGARILAAAAAIILAVSAPFIYQNFFKNESNPFPAISSPVTPADSTLISIRTEPPGANVFLDDHWMEKSPIEKKLVPSKRALLRVELAGYKEFSDTIELHKDEPFEKLIKLVERVGHLKITSKPDGAKIYLDGKYTGLSTPNKIENISIRNRHEIRLRLSGHDDFFRRSIQIHEDSTLAIHHDFSKLKFPLTIASKPAEASIWFDGKYVGNTPKSLGAVAYGSHKLELRKDGFRSSNRTIEVPAPNNLVETDLIRLPPGKIVFKIYPYAEVWINGKLKEETAVYYELELKPGTYKIELRHPRYKTVHKTVELKSGETASVSHRFSEEKEK